MLTVPTGEDTVLDDEEGGGASYIPKTTHRHYDRYSETVPEGAKFASDFKGVEVVRRRNQQRLAVSYHPALEPLGAKREAYYQQKLILGLPWYCPDKPSPQEDGSVEWHFRWDPPLPAELQGGVVIPPRDLYLGRDEVVSFEGLAHELDDYLCSHEFGLVCTCCAFINGPAKCPSCDFAVGFHYCQHQDRDTDKLRWRKGTLFAGQLDTQRCLNNLSKKGCPIHVSNALFKSQ
jgi:hypothetical protein